MEIIYHHFESLSSTNDWAKDYLAVLEHNALLLVTADGQTAARGQFGRTWLSPKGENLYASFAFFASSQHEPLTFTHLLALSAAAVLNDMRISCRLKWPNDLLVNHKKIAGILCETVPMTHLGVILGIGLNVNMTSNTLKAISQPATSLFCETGQTYCLDKVCNSLKDKFREDLTLFLEQGFRPFQETFNHLLL